MPLNDPPPSADPPAPLSPDAGGPGLPAYLEALAAGRPTPGGGSAVAVTAADGVPTPPACRDPEIKSRISGPITAIAPKKSAATTSSNAMTVTETRQQRTSSPHPRPATTAG